MNLDLSVPDLKYSSNSKPTSVSIPVELDQEIKEIKKSPHDKKLFNELHRQALEKIVDAFKSGEVFRTAGVDPKTSTHF